MATPNIWLYIATMAGVTYLIRLLPFLLLRKEIKHPVIRAFLYYVPYATLSAMTLPAALMGDTHWLPSLCGLLTAGILAYRGINLLATAAIASLAVYLTSLCL